MSLTNTSNPVAVMDIGSNSVRLVVYHALSRVPVPLFNEKYYCGLARGLNETGELNAQGMQLAEHAIARFTIMLKRFKISRVICLATAAMRDASNGPAYVKHLRRQYGLNVTVITGLQEAHYGAQGVLAAFHQPHGVVADMGGGSLELSRLHNGTAHDMVSLEAGTLVLLDLHDHHIDDIRAFCRSQLAPLSGIHNAADAQTLYAVGGSFRAIAKTHIRQSGYPLELVHEYHLKKQTIAKLVQQFSELSVEEIGDLPGIPRKRAPTMLTASIMLHELMEHTAAPTATFSVSGIREGVLFDRLGKERRTDPLIASASDLGKLAGRRGHYAQELFDWMAPLFTHENADEKRLRMAMCLLSEVAWTIDPNYRSEWAYLRVLHSAIKGVSHRERVMLSMAVFHRYQNKWKQDHPETILVDEKDRLWARCTGVAANLAFNVSGGQTGNLHHARLEVSGSDVSLILDDEAKPLRTDTVEKKLDGLGVTFKALSNFVI